MTLQDFVPVLACMFLIIFVLIIVCRICGKTVKEIEEVEGKGMWDHIQDSHPTEFDEEVTMMIDNVFLEY